MATLNAYSRCAPAYLFLPSGSSESPTPASAEGASLLDEKLACLGTKLGLHVFLR